MFAVVFEFAMIIHREISRERFRGTGYTTRLFGQV